VVATKPDSAGGCLTRLTRGEPSGDSCVVALKTLTIQPSGAQFRNLNPAVATFSVLNPAGTGDIHATPMLPLGTAIGVEPSPVPESSSETKADGTREVMTYSWFATQKDFDHFHSGYSNQPPFENPANTYTNQSTMPGRVHFWLVLRDDRGG